MDRVKKYWEDRFAIDKEQGPKSEDWVLGAATAAEYVLNELNREKRTSNNTNILILACGTSSMVCKIYDAGYTNITCTDISKNAIDIQKLLHNSNRPNLKFVAADATQLSGTFAPNSFDMVIDKTGCDSILFRSRKKQGEGLVRRMFGEIIKVLKPESGLFLMFSVSRFRTHLLLAPDLSLLQNAARPAVGCKRARIPEVGDSKASGSNSIQGQNQNPRSREHGHDSSNNSKDQRKQNRKTEIPWRVVRKDVIWAKDNVKYSDITGGLVEETKGPRKRKNRKLLKRRERSERASKNDPSSKVSKDPSMRYSIGDTSPDHEVYIYVLKMGSPHRSEKINSALKGMNRAYLTAREFLRRRVTEDVIECVTASSPSYERLVALAEDSVCESAQFAQSAAASIVTDQKSFLNLLNQSAAGDENTKKTGPPLHVVDFRGTVTRLQKTDGMLYVRLCMEEAMAMSRMEVQICIPRDSPCYALKVLKRDGEKPVGICGS